MALTVALHWNGRTWRLTAVLEAATRQRLPGAAPARGEGAAGHDHEERRNQTKRKASGMRSECACARAAGAVQRPALVLS
jgi:hypothetical protein